MTDKKDPPKLILRTKKIPPLKKEPQTPPPSAPEVQTNKKVFISREDFLTILKDAESALPHLFGKKPKLLAIGIHRDFAEKLGISLTKSRRFLAVYCRSKAYTALHTKKSKRYDINGNESIINKQANIEG